MILDDYTNELIIKYINNKTVCVLGSGPSVTDFKIPNDVDTIIIPNRNIVLPKLNFNQNIIWICGPGCRVNSILNWLNQLINNRTCNPKIILTPKNKFKKNYYKFKEICLKNINNSHIYNYENKTSISTGMMCIKLAINFNSKKIYISGFEMGKNTKYTSLLLENKIVSNDDSFKRHLNDDIKYIQSLNNDQLKKLIVDDNSGLYEFLQN